MLNNFEYVGGKLLRGGYRDLISDARKEFQMISKNSKAFAAVRKIMNSSQEALSGNYYDAMRQSEIMVDNADLAKLQEAIFEATRQEQKGLLTGVTAYSQSLPLMEVPQKLSNPVAILRMPGVIEMDGHNWKVLNRDTISALRGLGKCACLGLHAQISKLGYTLNEAGLSIMVKPAVMGSTDMLVKFQLQVRIGEEYRKMFADILAEAANKKNCGEVYRTQYNEITNFYLADYAWMKYENFVFKLDDWDPALDAAPQDLRHVVWSNSGIEIPIGASEVPVYEKSYAQLIGSNEELMWYDLIARYVPDYTYTSDEEYRLFLGSFPEHARRVAEEVSRERRCDFDDCWANRKKQLDFRHYSALTHIAHGYHKGKTSEFGIEFKKFLTGAIYTQLTRSDGRLSHMGGAKIISYSVNGLFYCDGKGVNRIWYAYVSDYKAGEEKMKQKWIMLKQEPRAISIDAFVQLESQLDAIVSGEDEAESKSPGAKFLKNLRSVLFDLGMMPRINNTLAAFGMLASESGIKSRMDIDGHVIGVLNGVLDMDLHSANPQPRLCPDFPRYVVTKSAGANYIPYNANGKWVKLWRRIFSEIFIEPDVCEYMWFRFATGLCEIATVITLIMIIAGGANGKSVVLDNILKVMGDYGAKLAISLLTHSHRGNSADTDLMQMEGKRCVFFAESNNQEAMDSSRLKTLNEKVKVGRHQYGENENFSSQPTSTMFSNYALNLKDLDYGTNRRIEAYHCKMRFISDPDPENPREKKADRSFETLAYDNQHAADALFSILVYYRVRLNVEYGGDFNNVPRPTIAEETRNFQNSQDKLSMFISTKLVRFRDISASYRYNREFHEEMVAKYAEDDLTIAPFISIDDLCIAYTSWYKKVEGRECGQNHDQIRSKFADSKLSKYIQSEFDGKSEMNGLITGFRLIPPGGNKIRGETFI